MQLLNDYRGIGPDRNVITVQATCLQNGIWVLRQFVVTCKAIAANSELLL